MLYLGGRQFTNFWPADPPYTLHSKCLEMFQWHHAAYTDAAGEVRIYESGVEQRLQALATDPAQTAQILRQMLRLHSPPGAADPGGCLNASRVPAPRLAWQRRPGAAVGLVAAGLNANVERYRVNSI